MLNILWLRCFDLGLRPCVLASPYMLVRHLGNASVFTWRHKLTANSLILWPLQSFHLLLLNFHWGVGGGTTQPCHLIDCGFVEWAPSVAKGSSFMKGDDYTYQ